MIFDEIILNVSDIAAKKITGRNIESKLVSLPEFVNLIDIIFLKTNPARYSDGVLKTVKGHFFLDTVLATDDGKFVFQHRFLMGHTHESFYIHDTERDKYFYYRPLFKFKLQSTVKTLVSQRLQNQLMPVTAEQDSTNISKTSNVLDTGIHNNEQNVNNKPVIPQVIFDSQENISSGENNKPVIPQVDLESKDSISSGENNKPVMPHVDNNPKSTCFCASCGNLIDYNSAFCMHCGALVKSISSNAPNINTSTIQQKINEMSVDNGLSADEDNQKVPFYFHMWFISLVFWFALFILIGPIVALVLFIIRQKNYPNLRKMGWISMGIQIGLLLLMLLLV